MPKERLIAYSSKIKKYLSLLIITVTLAAFYLYLKSNPEALSPISSTPLYLVPLLLVLYGFFLISNFFITAITITISHKTYPLRNSFLLTIYSTLVNFFGPLQSGPGFRAIYLKKKIGLTIKDYTLATMLYYGSFAAISLLMMFGLNSPLLSAAGVIIVIGFSLFFFRNQKLSTLIRNSVVIGAVTLVQLLLVALIYYIELRATGYNPSLSSMLAYTGSANLALFVSFTPGAIGIRESFLYFSQTLHGIPTEQIISASLLDRAVYIIFLGILFIVSSSLHLQSKLRINKSIS